MTLGEKAAQRTVVYGECELAFSCILRFVVHPSALQAAAVPSTVSQ